MLRSQNSLGDELSIHITVYFYVQHHIQKTFYMCHTGIIMYIAGNFTVRVFGLNHLQEPKCSRAKR